MNAPNFGSRSPWNKGRAQGQRRAFTQAQIHALEAHLLARQSWHDLALLAFGLDSLFRSCDLLPLTVRDATYPNGQIRTLIPIQQQKTKRAVSPALTPATQHYVRHWIRVSGKAPHHALFTRNKSLADPPICRSTYAEVVKGWATALGLPSEEFSTHSIRRTKASHMHQAGEDLALISRLLGHKSLAVTIEYLGLNQTQAEAASLRHPMMQGLPRTENRRR